MCAFDCPFFQKASIKTERKQRYTVKSQFFDKVVKNWNDGIKHLWDMTKCIPLGSVGIPEVYFLD